MTLRTEKLGSRIDRLLRTRPLFETVLLENKISGYDRCRVIALTLLAIGRYRGKQAYIAIAEPTGVILFRNIFRGRVPRSGMERILEVGALTWYRAKSWNAAQRARLALGAFNHRQDQTVLYCGWRFQIEPGQVLPVFILADEKMQVLEVAYGGCDEDGLDCSFLTSKAADRDERIASAMKALVASQCQPK